MTKRFLWIELAVITAVVLFSGSYVFSQEDVTAVEDSAFGERMRPKAVFFHEEHNEKAEIGECNVCHHVYDGTELKEDETSEDRECSSCHMNEKSGGLLNLANIYHRQCKGCHMEKKKGPVMCNECHVKK